MWGLIWRRRHEERGASAVIVAVFVSMVAFALLAFTVNIGNGWFERRQLQNGADAAVMALARSCATGQTDCSPMPSAGGLPATLASANDSVDSKAKLADLCWGGTPAPTGWATCAGGNLTDLTKCPPVPSGLAGVPYVQLNADTLTDGGSTLVPLLGSGSGKTHTACARAAWGPPGISKLTLPLVIGQCNWDAATAVGFAQSPPYSVAASATTTVPSSLQPFITSIFGQVNGSETDVLYKKFGCWGDLSTPPSGGYTPGGFGWVKTCAQLGLSAPPECEGADACNAVFDAIGTANASTGASLPSACADVLQTKVGTEVDIPVVTSVTGTGSNAVYAISGISSFYLAGFKNVPSASPPPGDKSIWKDNANSYKDRTCFPYKSTCVWGWFTSPVRPVGTISSGGANPRGPITIQPAG